VFHLLQSESLRTKAEAVMTGSAGQRRVPGEFFSEYHVPSFAQPEQHEIAGILDDIEATIKCTAALVAKLKMMHDGLVHDLLTRGVDAHGELRDPLVHPEQFSESGIGEVPADWELVTLGDVVSRSAGVIQTGPFGSQLHADEYTRDGIPVIMPQDIDESSRVDEQRIARISEVRAASLSRHRVHEGDVVFARRGELSRCAAIRTREVGWICGTGCLLIRPPKNELDATWLTSMYRHDRCQRQILARAVGSTMVNLNTTLLSGILIARPSIDEQRELARRIDVQNREIESEQLSLHKLTMIRSGLMHDLLTGAVRAPITVEGGP
jgi:type I restriction enzyme S subunit